MPGNVVWDERANVTVVMSAAITEQLVRVIPCVQSFCTPTPLLHPKASEAGAAVLILQKQKLTFRDAEGQAKGQKEKERTTIQN